MISLLILVSNSVIAMTVSHNDDGDHCTDMMSFYFTGNPVSFIKTISVRHQCNAGKKDSGFRVLWWNGKKIL